MIQRRIFQSTFLALTLSFGFFSWDGVGVYAESGTMSSTEQNAPQIGDSRDALSNETQETKVVINIPSRTLWVYKGERIIRAFPVGVGRVGFSTPIGQYRVLRMVTNPGWENPYLPKGKMVIKPGTNNPLGTRWIGFKQDKRGEYGIHGTDNPASVGKFSSHGCVRMKIPDAEALFEMVQIGTPVEVVYDVAIVDHQSDTIRLAVYPDVFKRGMPTAEVVKQLVETHYPSAFVDMNKVHFLLKNPTQTPQAIGKTPSDSHSAEAAPGMLVQETQLSK